MTKFFPLYMNIHLGQKFVGAISVNEEVDNILLNERNLELSATTRRDAHGNSKIIGYQVSAIPFSEEKKAPLIGALKSASECWDKKPLLYLAMLLPNEDGSGDTEVLGLYSDKTQAEARCYLKLKNLGYHQPTSVTELTLDEANYADDGLTFIRAMRLGGWY